MNRTSLLLGLTSGFAPGSDRPTSPPGAADGPAATFETIVGDWYGTARFEKEYPLVRPGRVGLWSKADSQVVFDDVTGTPPGGHGPSWQ